MKKFVYFIFLTLGTSAFASASSTVPGDRTIIRLMGYEDALVVHFDPPFTDAEGCGGDKALDHGMIETSQLMKGMAVTAFTTGQQVGFGLSGCHGWSGGIPIIYRFVMPDS